MRQNDPNGLYGSTVQCLVDLDSLRCFTEGADTLNFRAAARRVALSPAAFSERIRRLEDELGAPLFVRTTRRIRLTELGRQLLPQARRVLAELQRCRDLVGGSDGPVPFTLTLGTRFELGMSWLCPSIGALRQARPERTVHLFMGDTPDLLSRVERGDIDAVVFSARLVSHRLTHATLHPETYVFVGAPSVLQGKDALTRRSAARHHTLVDVSGDLPLFHYLMDALADAEPWTFDRHEYMGGIGPIRHRVLEGAGVAVLPEYFVRQDLETGRLVRLLPEIELLHDAFRLVWRRGHPLEDELLALAHELRERPLS
jgi:LysR family glycine cleavage system transcriptional activator